MQQFNFTKTVLFIGIFLCFLQNNYAQEPQKKQISKSETKSQAVDNSKKEAAASRRTLLTPAESAPNPVPVELKASAKADPTGGPIVIPKY